MLDTNYTHRQFHNLACYALSKICLAAQYLVVNISLCNNNISIIRSNISLHSNDILMIRSDISLSCSDILLSVHDISLSGSDISLGKNDISLSGSNILLGEDDKSRRTQRNICDIRCITFPQYCTKDFHSGLKSLFKCFTLHKPTKLNHCLPKKMKSEFL